MYLLLNGNEAVKHAVRSANLPTANRTSCTFRLDSVLTEEEVSNAILSLFSDDDMYLNEYNVADFLRFELNTTYDYVPGEPDEEGNPTTTAVPNGCSLLLTNEPVYIPPEPVIPSEEELLATARTNKKQEMIAAKTALVVNGIDVETEYGMEHFPLTQENITLLTGISVMISNGLPSYPFHSSTDAENTNICKTYSAADLQKIITTIFGFVTYQESYCNMLLQWIDRETDRSVIENMTYGVDLPEDLAAYMQMLLATAGGQTPETPETETPTEPSEGGGTEGTTPTTEEQNPETPSTEV